MLANIYRYFETGGKVMNLLRLKENYKQVADGKMLIAKIDDKKRGLGKVISELDENNPLRVAYGQLKGYKRTAKDLDMKGDNAKAFVVEKIKEYADSIDVYQVELEILKASTETLDQTDIEKKELSIKISRDVLKYLTMLNDNTVARNLVDNYYILTGIHYKVLEDGQGQFTLVNEMFLGNKKSLGQSKPVIALVPKIKDVLRDTDIIFSASDKWTELFISLLAEVKEDKEEFGSFKEYVENLSVKIEGMEKEFRRTKELLVKYYINL